MNGSLRQKMCSTSDMSYQYYNKNSQKFIEDTINIDMDKHYKKFLEYLRRGASILDAGCGSGRDAFCFKKLGYDVDAFDASSEMVKSASLLTGIPVMKMTFENIELQRNYEGIWACASLLHVKRANLSTVLKKLSEHLVKNGVIYSSFKYGDQERYKGERYFNDMNEEKIVHQLNGMNFLNLSEYWISNDARKKRATESWLNCILIKT